MLEDPRLVAAYLGTNQAVVERSGKADAPPKPAKKPAAKRAPRKRAPRKP